MKMDITLSREDLKGLQWLQVAIEHVLEEETKRRAQAAGRLPPNSTMWRVSVTTDESYAPTVIEVSYQVSQPRPPAGNGKNSSYTEEYTLAEALALAFGQAPLSPSKE